MRDNSTKRGVDTFYQSCSYQSCNCMTKRWSPVHFYRISNTAVVNSYILYKEHKPQNTLKRRFFQKKLAF